MEDFIEAIYKIMIILTFMLIVIYPIILIGLAVIAIICIFINDRCRNFIKDKFMFIYQIIKKA